MSVNYNSGKNIFIGWGLPANPEKLAAEKYEGALLYDSTDQTIKYSNGQEWTEPLNPPIRKPYALEPTNSAQQSQLRLSKFLTSAEFKDVYYQIAVSFQVYRDEEMLDPVELPFESDAPEEDWINFPLTFGVIPPTYYEPEEDYIIEDGEKLVHIRSLYQLPKGLFKPDQKFYWRAKYIANDNQESAFSDLYEQTYPSIIDQPYARTLPNLITDKVEISAFSSAFDKTYNKTIWEFQNIANTDNSITVETSLDFEQLEINPYRINILTGFPANTFYSGNTYRWRALHVDQDNSNSAWSLYSTVIVPETEYAKLIFDTRKSNTLQVELYLIGTNMTVDWGDGSSNTIPTTNVITHDYYGEKKEYIVIIHGNLTGFTFGDDDENTPVQTDTRDKLTKIKSFGRNDSIKLFRVNNCKNLEEVPSYLPPSITTCRFMFRDCTKLNQDLDLWDTKNITDMQYMFQRAISFNGDISTWNTSNVGTVNNREGESFRYMFDGATSFNKNINFQQKPDYHGHGEVIYWDTSQSFDMSYMFRNARSFNGNIRAWELGIKCENTASMFEGAISFNNDLSKWDFKKVTDVSNMFRGATSFNRDVGSGDFTKVTNFSNMFKDAAAFNKDISHWQIGTTNNINMSGMFEGTNINTPLNTDTANSYWIVSRVTDMSNMFKDCLYFNQSLSNWNTANVKNVSNMFNNARNFNQPLITSNNIWNMSNVENASYMFSNTIKFNQDLSWNLSNAIDLSGMFKNSIEFNSNVRFILCSDAEKSINLNSMFHTTPNFNKPLAYNLNSDGAWNTSRVSDIEYMFYNATEFNQYIGNWNLSNISKMRYLFYNASSFNQNIGDWSPYIINITDMNNMFYNAVQFNNNGNTSIGNWQTNNVISISNLFFGANNFNQPIGNWNTSNVSSFYRTFGLAKSFDQELNSWNTANVTNMAQMFDGATSFNKPVNNWNTANVTTMALMFRNATSFDQSLTTDENKWNTANVTHMVGMFNNAQKFNQNLSSWDTSKVTDMNNMFNNAIAFNNGEAIGGSNNALTWETSKVISMANMFQSTGFNQNISNWNTANVVYMQQMFYNTPFNQSINTNGNNWNTANVKYMGGMFGSGYIANTVGQFDQDISDWDTSNVLNMNNMFLRSKFNKPLTTNENKWNVSRVTSMTNMFYQSKFDRDISSWDVRKVGNMQQMFRLSKLSTANYDALLNKNTGWPRWSGQGIGLRPNVVFDAGNSTYTDTPDVTDGRAILTGPINNWTVIDKGEA